MKKLLLLLPFLMLGCDTNDEGIQNDSNQLDSLELTVVSVNPQAQKLTTIDINVETEEVVTSNLTDQIGLPSTAFRAIARNNELSWYETENGNFNVWQKNTVSNATKLIEAPCEIIDENLQTVANTESEIIYFTRFFGTSNFPSESRLRIYSEGQECKYLAFEGRSIIGIHTYASTVLIEALNIFDSEDIKVIKINTTTGQIEGDIAVNTGARITADQDTLHVFNLDNTYSTYSLTSFQLINTVNFTLVSQSTPGFFYSSFKDGTMLLDVPYAQPSLIGQGPAIVDLATSEFISPYSVLFSIQGNLREQEGYEGASIGAYDADLEKGIIVAGFANFGDEESHGIVVTNFDGTILKIIDLNELVSELVIQQ